MYSATVGMRPSLEHATPPRTGEIRLLNTQEISHEKPIE